MGKGNGGGGVKPVTRCLIEIIANAATTRRDGSAVIVTWEPELPAGPHEVSPVEVMAAGALLGMAKAVTGKGSAAVLRSLIVFDETHQNEWAKVVKLLRGLCETNPEWNAMQAAREYLKGLK